MSLRTGHRGLFLAALLTQNFLAAGEARAQAIAAEDPTSPATLSRCYDWARERSEALKRREEDQVQSKARARAAFGRALPAVAWELNGTRQEPEGVRELESRGFSGFVQKEQVESKFTVKQTLFSGLRESSARSGFKREAKRDALNLERSARELYEETARVFYAVVGHETQRNNTADAVELAEGRVKDLREFLRLGKAREGELFTAQARAAALKAELRQARSRVAAAREELSFLTGQDFSTRPLKDELPAEPAAPSLAEALDRAKARSDLRAQAADIEAKKFRVRYERGYYWPSLDLSGNYYTRRATFMSAIDWDLLLALKVPLFQGGAVAARVKEAASAHRQAVLALQELERRTLYAVRRLHGEFAAALEESRSLDEAVQAARKSYQSMRGEYSLGLVTNLDVLQALELLRTQKDAHDAARLKAKQLYIGLQVAIEALP